MICLDAKIMFLPLVSTFTATQHLTLQFQNSCREDARNAVNRFIKFLINLLKKE